MKKFFLPFMIFTTTVFSNDFIAKLDNIKNSVEIHRESSIIQSPNNGVLLNTEDIIKTNENSSVDIIFKDGTAVSLGAKSVLLIDDYIYTPKNKKFKFEVSLEKGVAVYESGKISEISPEDIKFKVPTGTIGVRGTKFLVEVIEE